MLDCRKVLENLSFYLDGEGTEELRRALEEHIARCRRCRLMLDTTRQTLKIVVDAEPFEVPLAVSARLYARVASLLADG
jgi:predicted anti-sigma-YlaC factor YlaD